METHFAGSSLLYFRWSRSHRLSKVLKQCKMKKNAGYKKKRADGNSKRHIRTCKSMSNIITYNDNAIIYAKYFVEINLLHSKWLYPGIRSVNMITRKDIHYVVQRTLYWNITTTLFWWANIFGGSVSVNAAARTECMKQLSRAGMKRLI